MRRPDLSPTDLPQERRRQRAAKTCLARRATFKPPGPGAHRQRSVPLRAHPRGREGIEARFLPRRAYPGDQEASSVPALRPRIVAIGHGLDRRSQRWRQGEWGALVARGGSRRRRPPSSRGGSNAGGDGGAPAINPRRPASPPRRRPRRRRARYGGSGILVGRRFEALQARHDTGREGRPAEEHSNT